MAANADIQVSRTLGLDQKAAVPPSQSLDKSETESGDDADAIRERILAERLQASNPPVFPIMTLLLKKDHKQLDEIATQRSVYDDPSISRFFTPTARYENLHRFGTEARWTWREDLPLINKIDWKITLWACIAFLGLDMDRGNLSQANTDNFLEDLGLSTDGNTVFRLAFLCAELPSQLVSKKLGPDRWTGKRIVL
ncbi:hypothetical protein INS49_014169 [Diaporthe citri]|uniref:uncharacterized protein n=1 Tax=Diaporthe citri TaxID=83186 RepID=UPI001C7E2717|nr:uncharacterized protein INS49_014169 [Diaporthe citri]KAG6358285.1 hypothetical protein INS49_014169 [Diaporthe citri]